MSSATLPASAQLAMPQARRAALLLSAATAIGGSVGPIAIGTGALVGMSLLPVDQIGLATLPVTAFILGSALASIPAALSMQKLGRRTGFMLGAGLGGIGALCAASAILFSSFWLFATAMLLMGAASAFGQQYRFAAADAAPPDFKAKAIAWVMAGGVVTGIVGPQISIHGQGLLANAPAAGPFIILAGLFLLTILLLSVLKVPPPAPRLAGSAQGRPLREILFQPKFLIALLAAIASYALMSLVMTASPLAMIEHHHTHADAQVGIQWHVIAMFGPSFFTGNLIARFGKSVVAASGLLLIAGAATVALSGTGLWYFWIALILLGMGWNFGFIAATAMVAELYRPEEAFRVQAMNEFILFSIVALASLSSGGILVTGGWTVINLVVYPIVAISVTLIVGYALYQRRRPVRLIDQGGEAREFK